MERTHVIAEAIGIACISAGCGILLHFVLPMAGHQEVLIVFLVIIVVWAVVVKVLPYVRKSGGIKRFATAPRWPTTTQQKPSTERVSHKSQGTHMSEMTRYFAWIEKKLQELVVREGLECGLVRMKRGPLVITLQLRLINPTQKDLQKLMKLGPALAQLLQVETVRIADSAQGILIEVPSPRPLTPNGALLARHTRGLIVAVGVNAAARPILVNLEDHGALFWVGPSRRGKTQSMKSVLYSLIKENLGQIQFIIIANPAKVRNDWGVFSGVQGCLGIASTKEDIVAAANWLVAEMTSVKSLAEGTRTVLVVDDLPVILKAVPQITGSLGDVAGMGAGLGVHLLVGTQGAGSKNTSGGTEIENNVTARVLYRPSTTRSGSQSAGTGGLALHQLSSAKGDALALIDGHTTRIATAWISDQDIALLPSGSCMYPWRSEKRPNKPENQAEPPKTRVNTMSNQVEPCQNQREPDRTTQNYPEPPTTWSATMQRVGAVATNRIDNTEPVSKPVLEPPAEPVVGMTKYLAYLATLSNEQLRSENLGFDISRNPNQDEQRIMVLAFEISKSLNKTCLMCYGYKNPKVIGYIKAAIGDQISDVTEAVAALTKPTSQIPDTIDLDTETGRELLRRLQGNGLINWPDVDDLLSSER